MYFFIFFGENRQKLLYFFPKNAILLATNNELLPVGSKMPETGTYYFPNF